MKRRYLALLFQFFHFISKQKSSKIIARQLSIRKMRNAKVTTGNSTNKQAKNINKNKVGNQIFTIVAVYAN